MTEPAIPGLTRHYLTLGNRQVHYRRMGKGPPCFLLHRAPRSSEDLLSFMGLAAQDRTVIAPDLPGYGASSSFEKPNPSIEDFAKDFIAFMEALGIARAPLYGEQVGRCIALAAAEIAPDRVAGVAVRDIMVDWWADPDLARINLKAFLPSWDGSHYAWLWAMLRDEAVFEPFYSRDLAHRLEEAMPDPQELNHRVRQFVTPGHHGRAYGVGFAAALDWDINEALSNISCPVTVLGTISRRQGGLVDALSVKVGQQIETLETADQAVDRAADLLRQWSKSGDPSPRD